MKAPTGGLDPGLWRAVVRPLLQEGVERVLYDLPRVPWLNVRWRRRASPFTP